MAENGTADKHMRYAGHLMTSATHNITNSFLFGNADGSGKCLVGGMVIDDTTARNAEANETVRAP